MRQRLLLVLSQLILIEAGQIAAGCLGGSDRQLAESTTTLSEVLNGE